MKLKLGVEIGKGAEELPLVVELEMDVRLVSGREVFVVGRKVGRVVRFEKGVIVAARREVFVAVGLRIREEFEKGVAEAALEGFVAIAVVIELFVAAAAEGAAVELSNSNGIAGIGGVGIIIGAVLFGSIESKICITLTIFGL